jgi:diguanylate cyclase (GGDEF)-like protein
MAPPSIHLIDVLLVEDDEDTADRVRADLGPDFEVRREPRLVAAARASADRRPDIVVVDLAVPDATAVESVRGALGSVDAPVVVLVQRDDPEPELRALLEGARGWLSRDELGVGVLPRCLRYALELDRMEQELRRLAHVDPLTGLFNRRHLHKTLPAAVNAARRHGHPLTVCLGDVDTFKAVNDLHGHLVGDEVLQLIANVLQGALRREDTAIRFGGDEFCLVLPYVDAQEARAVLARIARRLDELWPVDGGPHRISMTFGLAQLGVDADDGDGLLAAADADLYRRKGGRPRP